MTELASALDRLDPESPEFRFELKDVMAAVAASADRDLSFSLIFAFMEKHPEADFGAPGPIVHTLEKMGGYEGALADSIRRKPIHHTVWMVNRILNSPLPLSEREMWLGELRRVVGDPSVSIDVQGDALDFLQHQSGR
jgi:hypothetical protein